MSKIGTRFHLFLSRVEEKFFSRFRNRYWDPKLIFQNPLFVIATFALSLTPLLFACLTIGTLFSDLTLKKSHFEKVKRQGEKIVKADENRSEFLKTYGRADPDYLNCLSERLVFLQPEIKTLETICNSHFFPVIKNRLSHLVDGANRLMFVEKDQKSSELIEEVHYTQKKLVEVDAKDIENILLSIEKPPILTETFSPKRPQFTVRSFELNHQSKLERESYLLKMELIKRTPL